MPRSLIKVIPTINSDPYDQTGGNLGCVDPHSKLDEGKCICMPGYIDLGHGCRYEQPRAFVEQFWFAMNQSSYALRWDGKFLFPRFITVKSSVLILCLE